MQQLEPGVANYFWQPIPSGDQLRIQPGCTSSGNISRFTSSVSTPRLTSSLSSLLKLKQPHSAFNSAAMKSVFVKLLLVLSATSLGLAEEDGLAVDNPTLKCYSCSGPVGSQCDNNNVKNGKDSLLVDCEPGQFCRVIRQDVRGEMTMIRKCGSELYKNSTEDACYKTVHQEFSTFVCQCFSNECNGVSAVQASGAVLASLLMALFVV